MNSESLIRYFQETQKQGKPLHIQGIKKLIKTTYLKEEKLTDEEAILLLEIDSNARFSSYPRLKSILIHLLSHETIDVDVLKSIKEEDFQPDIVTYFKRYNDEHGYFKEDEPTKELYQRLIKACRAMIVLIEQNNTSEDTMAYEYIS